MLVVPFVCAEFHDKSGNVIHTIRAHELRNITEVPDAIMQDPLYALMVKDGTLKAPENKLDLKALETIRTLQSRRLKSSRNPKRKKRP